MEAANIPVWPFICRSDKKACLVREATFTLLCKTSF